MSMFSYGSDLSHFVWNSPIGHLGLVTRNGKLAGIGLRTDPENFAQQVERTYGSPGHDDRGALSGVIRELEEYFAGRRLVFRIALDLDQGTPFQRRVWKAVSEIPYGETVTYRDVAQAIGQPSAVRAVGTAAGQNPIPIVVPCHRVVGSGGKLGGYSAGTPIKTKLLDLETRTRMEASVFGMLSESSRGKYRPRPWR